VFCSNYTTPGLSFAAALHNNAGQKQTQQQNQVPVAGPPAGAKSSNALVQRQKIAQLTRSPIVNSQTHDNMLRVVTVVQQIMTRVQWCSVRRGKRVTITKIALNLMKKNGHYT
jgi:hypothetical protein